MIFKCVVKQDTYRKLVVLRKNTGKSYEELMEEMVSDYFFKSIQGSKVSKLEKAIQDESRKSIDLSFDKHEQKTYTLTLDYDDLNVIYHGIGAYTEIMEALKHLDFGMFYTAGETQMQERMKVICEKLRTLEPDLYTDLRFEIDEDYVR